MRVGFQRGQESERLPNLWKLRGRRKALERGREEGVGVGAAGG
jgi:hypothetical protein